MPKKKFKISTLTAIIAVFAIFFMAYVISATIFKDAGYNILVKITSNFSKSSDKIVMIVIDDKSIAELGRWPWKRTRFSEIFEYLNDYTNAQIIGFDALVTSRDPENYQSDQHFFNSMKNYEKVVAGVGFNSRPLDGGFIEDKELLGKNKVIIKDKRSEKYRSPSAFVSFSPFPRAYFANTKAFGSVNTGQDSDGYIRTIDQIINYKNHLYPSLSLLMYSIISDNYNYTLYDNYLISDKSSFKMPTYTYNGVAYSNLKFYPLNYDSYSHKNISASDVIESLRLIKKGKKPIIDPSEFSGKIVFVGAYANAQALQDVKRTPVSDLHPGVDIQATNLDNILQNDFFVKTNPAINISIAIILAMLTYFIVINFSITQALSATALIIISYFIFAVTLYLNNISIDILPPLVFLVLTLALSYINRYLKEGRKKEKIADAMGKYISKDVMENVVKNIDSVKLGGKKAEISVLFADIRGFTTISERLSAEAVSEILNEYFSEIVPIIERNHGVLNKFMGDAVLAIFGEPIQNKDHAQNAVRAADRILKKVKYLQQKWIEEGKPKIDIGVGIATGEAFVGNIGSVDRLEYTVIGDTVNTASRIENYNKIYKTKFLISQETYKRVQNIADVIKIREVTIRGKSHKMNIYEVLRLVE